MAVRMNGLTDAATFVNNFGSEDLSRWTTSLKSPRVAVAILSLGACMYTVTSVLLFKHMDAFFKRTYSRQPSVQLPAQQTRWILMTFLLASNLLRVATFAAIVVMLVATVKANFWVIQFLLAVPSLLFLSSFSIIVLFWAQVCNASYYGASMAQGVVLVANATGWTIFICLAAVAAWLKAPREFLVVDETVVGALSVTVSLLISLYGMRVIREVPDGLSKSSEREKRRIRVVYRVLLISLICPLLFATNAVLNAVLCYQAYTDVSRLTLNKQLFWVGLSCLSAEFLPSLLVAIILWPRTAPGENAIDSRVPLLLRQNFSYNTSTDTWGAHIPEGYAAAVPEEVVAAGSWVSPNLSVYPIGCLGPQSLVLRSDPTGPEANDSSVAAIARMSQSMPATTNYAAMMYRAV